ncbi:MAG TPA: LytTR family DNA-binding domain-containing protein [Candidatus Aquilonibacter sp.]|nr:LytTR family DNA-binding domain-containing protein [Candidatus Aquilonibacter sp.]
MIHTVLADDELLARQKLRQMLRQEPEIEIVGESSTALETIELVRLSRPELLFLDVRMPGKDAFSVIEELSSDSAVAMPAIVFTTAYDGYALRAFEIHAVDYLLKPFSSGRLHTSVQRAVQQIHAKQVPALSQSSEATAAQYAKRIVFKSRGRILFLPVGSIRWIGAEENYVRICTDSESHLLREPIGRMEEKLDPQMFLRVHRSSIVNLQYVKEVRTETGGESVVVLLSGQKLAMSRSYRTRINEWLARS